MYILNGNPTIWTLVVADMSWIPKKLAAASQPLDLQLCREEGGGGGG